MKTLFLTVLAACSLMLTTSAFSCEFHDGFASGAFGVEWRPYNSELYDAEGYSAGATKDSSADTEKKARPVFSNSAIRAARSAKNQVAQNDTDEDSSEESTDTE